MSSSIGTTSSGGVFIGGTASRLNTTALIDAAVAQRTARADSLQVEINKNTATIAAYNELQTLTSAIDSSLARLRGADGLFDTTERVWDQRSGTVSLSGGGNYLDFAQIAVTSEAEAGSYDIEIVRDARGHKVRSANVSDNTAALGYAGTFDLSLNNGGAPVTVNVAATDNLNDLATSINATTENSGVRATVIKTTETTYQLFLESDELGRRVQVTNVTGDDALAGLDITDGASGFDNVVFTPRTAQIRVDGVGTSRLDNNFDDLIPGLDIDVLEGTAGEIINLTVGNDTAAAKQAITDFIDAYNAFRDFVIKNQNVSANGVVAEDAILFSDSLLNGLADQYTDFIGQSFNSSGAIETIRDLGIEFDSNNKLSIVDEGKLDLALLNNFDDVRNAFAASATTNNNEFRLTRNTGTAATQSIAFNLTTDGSGTITGVTANGDASAFTIDGNRVVGAQGTVYEGLTFTYVGSDANVTINVDFNQGLSEKLINGANGYTDSVSGLIINEIANLQDQNSDKAEDAQEIRTRAEAFREQQIERYAKLESDLTALNTLLDQIRAILGNNKDDN